MNIENKTIEDLIKMIHEIEAKKWVEYHQRKIKEINGLRRI